MQYTQTHYISETQYLCDDAYFLPVNVLASQTILQKPVLLDPPVPSNK